jgi:hypothetical protein
MKTRIRAHQPNAKVSFFFDSEIPKYEISVRSLEAEATSLQALSLDAGTLDAARRLVEDIQFTLSNLDGLRVQLEQLRASGETSSNLEMGRRFPRWVDDVESLMRRLKAALSRVQSVLAAGQQQAPAFRTKGSKGIYGNQSKVADAITLAFVIGAGYTIYKASK